jgi:hypothetical protein
MLLTEIMVRPSHMMMASFHASSPRSPHLSVHKWWGERVEEGPKVTSSSRIPAGRLDRSSREHQTKDRESIARTQTTKAKQESMTHAPIHHPGRQHHQSPEQHTSHACPWRACTRREGIGLGGCWPHCLGLVTEFQIEAARV